MFLNPSLTFYFEMFILLKTVIGALSLRAVYILEAEMTQTHAKNLKQTHFRMVGLKLFPILNMS